MTRPSSKSSPSKTYGTGALGRAEQALDDDRPFAEIRRILHDALRLLSIHRWMFFVPFCLVSCGAFIVSLYYPRTYTATTSFEARNDPVMINLPLSAGAASFKYFRNTMVRDLTSVECMVEVVDELGLLKDAERNPEGGLSNESRRRRDSLARSLGSNLSISTVSPSELIDIVRITYTGPDPSIGRVLVDQVKRTYIRRTMAWIHDYLVRQRDYFRREAEDAAEEVLNTQREETKLRLANPHVNPADPGAVSVRLGQFEAEHRELALRRRDAEGELNALRELLAASDPLVVGPTESSESAGSEGFVSPEALRLMSQIQENLRSVAKLRDTRGMTAEHPEIRELIDERRRLESQLTEQRSADRLASTGPTAGSPALTADATASPPWHSDRARLLVQTAAQTARLKDLDVSLQSNELMLAELSQAKEEVYQKQEEFAEVMGRVSKAKARLAQAESTVGTIEPAIKAVEQDRLLQFSQGQPARGASTPVSPKAITVLILSLVAGVVAGALFVILAEILDHVYRSSGQVARSLGLPMLEAIDEIVTGQDRRRHLVYKAVVAPLIMVGCLGLTGLSGSMAYLSLTQPWTYQRIRSIPQAALKLFVDQPTTANSNTGL